MEKVKKHRFYHNWSFSGVLFVVLLVLMVGFLVGNVILTKTNGTDRENNSFTSADWEYMISEIERNNGSGKEFIVLKKNSEEITKKVKTICKNDYEVSCYTDAYIGEKASIIGYFEGDEKGYYVSFSRYITDSPYNSGNNVIIHVYTDDNYNVDEYR